MTASVTKRRSVTADADSSCAIAHLWGPNAEEIPSQVPDADFVIVPTYWGEHRKLMLAQRLLAKGIDAVFVNPAQLLLHLSPPTIQHCVLVEVEPVRLGISALDFENHHAHSRILHTDTIDNPDVVVEMLIAIAHDVATSPAWNAAPIDGAIVDAHAGVTKYPRQWLEGVEFIVAEAGQPGFASRVNSHEPLVSRLRRRGFVAYDYPMPEVQDLLLSERELSVLESATGAWNGEASPAVATASAGASTTSHALNRPELKRPELNESAAQGLRAPSPEQKVNHAPLNRTSLAVDEIRRRLRTQHELPTDFDSEPQQALPGDMPPRFGAEEPAGRITGDFGGRSLEKSPGRTKAAPQWFTQLEPARLMAGAVAITAIAGIAAGSFLLAAQRKDHDFAMAPSVSQTGTDVSESVEKQAEIVPAEPSPTHFAAAGVQVAAPASFQKDDADSTNRLVLFDGDRMRLIAMVNDVPATLNMEELEAQVSARVAAAGETDGRMGNVKRARIGDSEVVTLEERLASGRSVVLWHYKLMDGKQVSVGCQYRGTVIPLIRDECDAAVMGAMPVGE